MNTLVFDLDGTIADLWPLERATLLCMAGKNDCATLDQAYEQGQRNLFALFQIFDSTLSREQFDTQYQNIQNQMFSGEDYPDFPIFLKKSFLRGVPEGSCGLATGSFRNEAEFVLCKTGCRNYFSDSLILCRGEYEGEKSDGQVFLEIKKRNSSSFVMIGDSEGDILGATRAGMKAIRVLKQSTEKKQRLELQRAIKSSFDLA